MVQMSSTEVWCSARTVVCLPQKFGVQLTQWFVFHRSLVFSSHSGLFSARAQKFGVQLTQKFGVQLAQWFVFHRSLGFSSRSGLSSTEVWCSARAVVCLPQKFGVQLAQWFVFHRSLVFSSHSGLSSAFTYYSSVHQVALHRLCIMSDIYNSYILYIIMVGLT